MNATRLWFCATCDKTKFIRSKTKHFNSRFQKHKKEYGTVVKEYVFCKQECDEVIFIHTDTIQDCRIDQLLSFEYRSVYVNKTISMENFKAVTLSITVGYMNYKSRSYGLF